MFWNLQFSIMRVVPPVTRIKGAALAVPPSKVRLRRMTTCELEPVNVKAARGLGEGDRERDVRTAPGQSMVREESDPETLAKEPPSMQLITPPGELPIKAWNNEQGALAEQVVPVPVGEAYR
jgi:hypothetical protein